MNNREFVESLSITDIVPLKCNPRLSIKESVEQAIFATINSYGCLPFEYAILVRPLDFDNKFEVVSGNTRLKVAIAANLSALPAWVVKMTDEEAFFAAAESNSHGELTKLEHGFNGLKIPKSTGGRSAKGGLSEYARRIGVKERTLGRWINAASVLSYLDIFDADKFESRISALAEIASSDKEQWRFLVGKLDSGISISELGQLISPTPETTLVSAYDLADVKEGNSFNGSLSSNDSHLPTGKCESFDESDDQRLIDQGDQDSQQVAEPNHDLQDLERHIALIQSSALEIIESKASDSVNPMHLSISNEAYTPLEITQSAEVVFGRKIDLDCASCAIAQQTVQANRFFTIEDDGLSRTWNCENFFTNPPGGKQNKEWRDDKQKFVQWGESNQFLWFSKAEAEYLDGNAKQGIFLAFNDALRAMCPSVHKYPICWIDASASKDCKFISGGRIRFDSINENGDRLPQMSPTHSNFLVFLPPMDDPINACQAFKNEFSKYGTVVIPSTYL